MTERQLKLAITDDQWRCLDTMLSDFQHMITGRQGETLLHSEREVIAAVHAIKVLVSTRHYHKD